MLNLCYELFKCLVIRTNACVNHLATNVGCKTHSPTTNSLSSRQPVRCPRTAKVNVKIGYNNCRTQYICMVENTKDQQIWQNDTLFLTLLGNG
jgi:hypothetical protein